MSNRVFSIFFFLFTWLISNAALGQITFSQIPNDKQLVGRNVATNLGTVIFDGEVNSESVDYSSILVEVYRENELFDVDTQILEFTSGIAPFHFEFLIKAELVNYSFKVYGSKGEDKQLEKRIQDVVAGDVYIIQGQSNAEAKSFEGSSSSYQSEFIRVYASGTQYSSLLLADDAWHIGQGDGSRNTKGNTGQWGLVVARYIVDSLKIPVAIFNGAHGGQRIKNFQPPSNYNISIQSNYGRLYYRLKKTRLKEYVRAIFWSQGEQDAIHQDNLSTSEYQQEFEKLQSYWKKDYPNIEHIYIFQTKTGCNKPTNNVMKIREAQRLLANQNSNISLIPTAALTHYKDNCHFNFEDGYLLFAYRLIRLIKVGLYNTGTFVDEINTPMLTDAYFSSGKTLVLETNMSNINPNIILPYKISFSKKAKIVSITSDGNKVICKLSKSIGTQEQHIEMSYYAGGLEKEVKKNKKALEFACFYKFPIKNPNYITDASVLLYPIPSRDSLYVELPNTVSERKITLVDSLGKKIFSSSPKSNTFRIAIKQGTNCFYYLMIETPTIMITKKIMTK